MWFIDTIYDWTRKYSCLLKYDSTRYILIIATRDFILFYFLGISYVCHIYCCFTLYRINIYFCKLLLIFYIYKKTLPSSNLKQLLLLLLLLLLLVRSFIFLQYDCLFLTAISSHWHTYSIYLLYYINKGLQSWFPK